MFVHIQTIIENTLHHQQQSGGRRDKIWEIMYTVLEFQANFRIEIKQKLSESEIGWSSIEY